jgi:hypothetical protein
MDGTERPIDLVEQVFLRDMGWGANPLPWLLGGLAALGFAAVGFVVAILSRVDQLSLHAMTTLPTLLGIGALAAARTLACTPREVTVDPEGVRIEGRRGVQSLAWDQIAWASVATVALGYRRELVIFDVQGKTLTRLSEAFLDFDRMVESITERIAQRQDDATDKVRLRRARRSAVMTAIISLLLLGVVGANLWMARSRQRADRLLQEAGVPGEAEIARRFLAPNGITPRLEYRITTPDGRSATRNAEVVRPYWDQLEGATGVPVVYVPGEPEISRLANGEPRNKDITDSPLVMYGVCAVLGVLCLVFLGAAAFQWRGWDIKLDSKTGRISIKPFGAGK